jgi:hypothetical protein
MSRRVAEHETSFPRPVGVDFISVPRNPFLCRRATAIQNYF